MEFSFTNPLHSAFWWRFEEKKAKTNSSASPCPCLHGESLFCFALEPAPEPKQKKARRKLFYRKDLEGSHVSFGSRKSQVRILSPRFQERQNAKFLFSFKPLPFFTLRKQGKSGFFVMILLADSWLIIYTYVFRARMCIEVHPVPWTGAWTALLGLEKSSPLKHEIW